MDYRSIPASAAKEKKQQLQIDKRTTPKCESDYKKFILKNCKPNGWKQIRDDCWLDSALYALFASDIRNIFSEILDEMYTSRDGNIKNTAFYISNYLEILNNNSQLTRECKQFFKNLIIRNFSNYLTETDHDYDLSKDVSFRGHDVLKGNQAVILRLFNYMNKTEHNIKFEELVGDSLNDTVNESITIDSREPIIIINYLTGNQDNTMIGDIQKVHNYKLISYLSGISDHIIANVWCSDSRSNSFILYDNDAKANDNSLVKSILDYSELEIMKYEKQNVDEITLIYVREDLKTAVAKPANSP
jgi:hypothetical protein